MFDSAKKRLYKACLYHGLDVTPESIDILRIASRVIEGTQFIIRAASPLDIMTGEINLNTFVDQKDKKRLEKEVEIAAKNEKLAQEKYKIWREECIKLFRATVLVPKFGSHVTAENVADNITMCEALYSWILENTLTKKKRRLFF